ncbi:hypothetical protein WBJ53_17895 [Spirosoma sp. SC4-14]|uniref:hypothetical protein n=1 Tax=Spirosoma sp. SC4-14 TaxID=3128900 RepID=UPI0030D464D9
MASTLFISFYIVPLLIVLTFGLLANSEEETIPNALRVAILPGVNLLATIRFIQITIRVTVDWLTNL